MTSETVRDALRLAVRDAFYSGLRCGIEQAMRRQRTTGTLSAAAAERDALRAVMPLVESAIEQGIEDGFAVARSRAPAHDARSRAAANDVGNGS